MQTNKSFSSNTRFQRNRVKSFENMGHSNHFSHNHDNKKKFNKQRKFNGNRNTYGRYSETKDTKITTKVHMEKPTYVDEFPSLGKKVVKESVIRKTDDILKNNTYYVLANLEEFHEEVKPVKPVVESIWGKHSLKHIKDCYKKKTEEDNMKLHQKREKMKALQKKKMEEKNLTSSPLLYSYSYKSPSRYDNRYDNDMEDDNSENVHSDESDYGDYYY
tara:strand:+ start:94 stop:744 length:651 start_codon:yes stop_codon:yes gene_type:complete